MPYINILSDNMFDNSVHSPLFPFGQQAMVAVHLHDFPEQRCTRDDVCARDAVCQIAVGGRDQHLRRACRFQCAHLRKISENMPR